MNCYEKDFNGLKYCFYTPEGWSETKKYPVILYTHGAGTRGKDLSLIKNNPIVKGLLPFMERVVVVAPQCKNDSWFDIFGELLKFVDSIYEMPTTDKSKFYIIGTSMGGYTANQLMMSRSKMFAGAIVCCGGGMYWNAEKLKNIPIRLFHGEKDTTVYPEESYRMFEKLTKCGADVDLTVYPNCAHDCWTAMVNDTANIEWLLKQKRIIIK